MADLPIENRVPGKSGSTLATSVAERLREAIIVGDLAPGAKVPIDRVRFQYGVSLSPLREGLSRLASEGFLTMQDNRGYRVAEVSQNDLRQIISLRISAETLALRESIASGSYRWERSVMARLKVLRAIRRNLEDPVVTAEWERAHRAFHAELLSGADMPLVMSFVRTLHDLNDRYRRIFLPLHMPLPDTMEEHVAMATAAVERRTKDAVASLRAHIESTGARILKMLPKDKQHALTR